MCSNSGEIIQLNEALIANQVHRMLRAIHCEGRGADLKIAAVATGVEVSIKDEGWEDEGCAEHNAVDGGNFSNQNKLNMITRARSITLQFKQGNQQGSTLGM